MSFDSGIVDFCIGMAFFYLILTLVSTLINEYLMDRLRNLRAKYLLKGISGMFYDSQLVAKIYAHPLIRGLYRDEKLTKTVEEKAKDELPKEPDKTKRTMIETSPTTSEDLFQGICKYLPSYIPARTFASALLDILCPIDTGSGKRSDLLKTLEGYKNERIGKILLPLIDAGKAEEEKLRQNIERFFDDTMDRVSGWFARHAKRWLIVVAALVCILLNADSIMVGKMLWHDKELRAAVVQQAEKHKSETPPAGGKKGETKATPTISSEKIKETANELSPFPLGWAFPPKLRDYLSERSLTKWLIDKNQKVTENDPHLVPHKPIDIVFKVVGLFFTVLGISLGAPFWTNLLNNFVNLRRAGKVPAKAGQEKK